MMNSNRHVLRSTQNRPALQDRSSDQSHLIFKATFSSNVASQQQENIVSNCHSRPILTATRSIKKTNKAKQDENQMSISPMFTNIEQTNLVRLQTPSILEENKTREQLEQELVEL
jgi:hypothetical protein